MLVSPARNQSSSWTIDFRCSFLVVTSGKPCVEVEAHLMAEHRDRAGAGAVALLDAVGEHVFHQFEVLPHRASLRRRDQSAKNQHHAEQIIAGTQAGEAEPSAVLSLYRHVNGKGAARAAPSPLLHKFTSSVDRPAALMTGDHLAISRRHQRW